MSSCPLLNLFHGVVMLCFSEVNQDCVRSHSPRCVWATHRLCLEVVFVLRRYIFSWIRIITKYFWCEGTSPLLWQPHYTLHWPQSSTCTPKWASLNITSKSQPTFVVGHIAISIWVCTQIQRQSLPQCQANALCLLALQVFQAASNPLHPKCSCFWNTCQSLQSRHSVSELA